MNLDFTKKKKINLSLTRKKDKSFYYKKKDKSFSNKKKNLFLTKKILDQRACIINHPKKLCIAQNQNPVHSKTPRK